MSTLQVARATLRWHLRKARRAFGLLSRAMTQTGRSGRVDRPSVRWG